METRYNFELLKDIKVELEDPIKIFGAEMIQTMAQDLIKNGLNREGQCLNIAGFVSNYVINDKHIEIVEGWVYNKPLNAKYFHIFNYYDGHYFDLCSFMFDLYERYSEDIYLTACRKWKLCDFKAAMIPNKLKGCTFCSRPFDKYINDEGYLTDELDDKYICWDEFDNDYLVEISNTCYSKVTKGCMYQHIYKVFSCKSREELEKEIREKFGIII